MRLLKKLVALRPVNFRAAGPLALVVGGLMLGPAGPALSERDAPAVWVPLAPAGAALGAAGIGRPIVLVPFERTVTLPGPALESEPWAPGYLTPYVQGRPGAAAAARSDGAAAGQGPAVRRTGRSSVTLSDVLRAADWRRETAARLRAGPTFTPRF